MELFGVDKKTGVDPYPKAVAKLTIAGHERPRFFLHKGNAMDVKGQLVNAGNTVTLEEGEWTLAEVRNILTGK